VGISSMAGVDMTTSSILGGACVAAICLGFWCFVSVSAWKANNASNPSPATKAV
jgi:hypothetical protein